LEEATTGDRGHKKRRLDMFDVRRETHNMSHKSCLYYSTALRTVDKLPTLVAK
jgi:hypothetical protein